MSCKIFQVDSFADRAFAGNPAGVCVLERAATEQWMQDVAAEMNVAETAFLVPRADGSYDLRWFTPTVEVDLCGHATLGSAHVLWETGQLPASERARFHTKSGLLSAWREDGMIRMDFPAERAAPGPAPAGLIGGLGVKPLFTGRNRLDWLIEVEDEAAVRGVVPTLPGIAAVGGRGVIVTAKASSNGFD